MDLAEQIAARNSSRPGVNSSATMDELGLPILHGRPDYIAARILRKNDIDYRAGKADLLHTRHNRTELWLGHEQLPLNRKTIYRLAACDERISDWMEPQIFEMVMRCVRWLDDSKIIVDDEHYWDKEEGELKKMDKYMPAITSVKGEDR